MGAHQIFFGALGFDSVAELDAAVREVSGAGMGRGASALIEGTLREARRGGRTLLVSFEADMPASNWHPFTGTFHELAARARRGHVTMLYDGDGRELEVARAGGRDAYVLPPGVGETKQWLVLDHSPVSLAWLGRPTPLEFEVVRRDDGTSALDTRDWMGLYGRLFERDETLFLETETGHVHEWARPGEPNSTCVLARSSAELITVVEVLGPRPLEANGTTRTDTIELLLHDLVASFDASDYLTKDPHWRTRAYRKRTLWLARGVGPVAIRGS